MTMRVYSFLPATAGALMLALAVQLGAASAMAENPKFEDTVVGEDFLSAPIGHPTADPSFTLSPDDVATVERIETYLNEISTVHARFVQISSQGNLAEGELHMQRPGKLRFEYDPPHPVLLIADGSSLLYYDKELRNATFIPLRDTPLWFLVRPHVTLTERIEIVGLLEENEAISVSVEGEGAGDAGRVTLVFSAEPLALRKWIVTDAQGVDVQVALIEPEFDVAMNNELFQYGGLDLYNLERRDRNR